MRSIILATTILCASLVQAFAANTQLNCGSTYYVPLNQVDWKGTSSPIPSSVTATVQADASVVTASIGVVTGTSNAALILKPQKGATNVTITVSAPGMTAGSATFDLIEPPPTIVLDVPNMTSTTP